MCHLQREQVPDDYSRTDPEHKLIYRFVRTLFSAAQLTAECAIVTLVRALPVYSTRSKSHIISEREQQEVMIST